MADPKSIHEFLPTSGNIGSLFLVDDPDSQATSGYTTRNISMDDVGEMVNNGIDYTQDLDTENKKVIGAINELHGVDGYDVYDETRTSSNKYVQGDICIHSDSLQVCTDTNGAYGAWDSTKWSPTTIKALLALKADKTSLPDTIIISATQTVSLSANTSTVVTFTFNNVPSGYKIVMAYDNSYYANVIPALIRINNSTNVVVFNYYSTIAQEHTWACNAICMKNVN